MIHLGLKEDVKQNLIKFLCSSNCEKFKSVLDDIGKVYTAYSKFFTTKGNKVFVYLKLPKDCILKANRCINGNIRVYVKTKVSIDPSFGDGQRVISECDEHAFPDFVAMTFKSRSIDKIFSILETLSEGRKEISWCIDDVINVDTTSNPLNSTGKTCYHIKLTDIAINTVGAFYASTFQQAPTTVLVESRLFEKGYEQFKEAKKGILDSLKGLENIPITVYLSLIPCSL